MLFAWNDRNDDGEAQPEEVQMQKASSLGTTVNTVVADYLRQWTVQEDVVQQARREMSARFAQPNWEFAVGVPDDREQRNARR